jgi:hypothetical protein
MPPGTTRERISIRASYQACTNAEPSDGVPRCSADGGMPPLPPGDYEAVFVTSGEVDLLEAPARVPVTVTK